MLVRSPTSLATSLLTEQLSPASATPADSASALVNDYCRAATRQEPSEDGLRIVVTLLMARDEFTQAVKDALARRAGYHCSKPDCRRLTIGPSLESSSSVACVGVAAHITGAASNGPRYDASMSSESRSSIQNGIWLCATHATLIDRDTERFPVEVLNEWKRQHDIFILAKLGEELPQAYVFHDPKEPAPETGGLHQEQMIAIFVERVSRGDFERTLREAGHGNILQEVMEETPYSTLVRYATTRALVGGWFRDLIYAASRYVTNDPQLFAPYKSLPEKNLTKDERRRRIARFLQHMAFLEGQQVETPGFLSIAFAHERRLRREEPEECADEDDYTKAIDLESVRNHLHEVLETTLRLIADLDADTAIVEEVPKIYATLMSGLNARARILRHTLRYGTSANAAVDYDHLIKRRDEDLGHLFHHLQNQP